MIAPLFKNVQSKYYKFKKDFYFFMEYSNREIGDGTAEFNMQAASLTT